MMDAKTKRKQQRRINNSVRWVVMAMTERENELRNMIRAVESLKICACDTPSVWRDLDGHSYCNQCGCPAREAQDGMD